MIAPEDTNRAPTPRDLDIAQDFWLAQVSDGARIGRENESRIVAQVVECRGETGRDIGEAAGLDQRMGLAAGHKDMQRPVRRVKVRG
jgi:hypothetical protein